MPWFSSESEQKPFSCTEQSYTCVLEEGEVAAVCCWRTSMLCCPETRERQYMWLKVPGIAVDRSWFWADNDIRKSNKSDIDTSADIHAFFALTPQIWQGYLTEADITQFRSNLYHVKRLQCTETGNFSNNLFKHLIYTLIMVLRAKTFGLTLATWFSESLI